MRHLKMKGLIGLTLGVLFVTMISVNIIIGANANGSSINLDGIIKSASAQTEGSYLGPLCMTPDGTYYCCKGCSGSCNSPGSCPTCGN